MREYVARNLAAGQKMVQDMVPSYARRIWLRQQSMRSLRYPPWKNAVVNAAVRPLREAANAISLSDYAAAPLLPVHPFLPVHVPGRWMRADAWAKIPGSGVQTRAGLFVHRVEAGESHRPWMEEARA
jgi:hypothetical protein